jgi:hypothetical protein
MKQRGQLRPLIVPSPQQRADGLWREQIFLGADAVIVVATDLLVAAGATRSAVDYAVMDIQLTIIGVLPHLDAGGSPHLALAHDGRHYVVVSGPNVAKVIQLVSEHFGARRTDVQNSVAIFCVALRDAYDTVRQRATKYKITFPERVWLAPEEFDQGAAIIAAAIGPRTSPVIEEWQKRRAAESYGESSQNESMRAGAVIGTGGRATRKPVPARG